jgi:cephalosporin hydroxylase
MNHFYQNLGEDWFSYPGLYKKVVSDFPSGSHFVEVGSWKGRSSAFLAVEIINSGKNIKFDCVDTWKGGVEHQDMEEIINDQLYDIFLKNIENVKHIINPVRMTSLDASKLYEDESLDFVFIDASHEYEDVLDDLNAWYPKVKKGGTIAGHDYMVFEPVTRAVNEFFGTKILHSGERCFAHFKE